LPVPAAPAELLPEFPVAEPLGVLAAVFDEPSELLVEADAATVLSPLLSLLADTDSDAASCFTTEEAPGLVFLRA